MAFRKERRESPYAALQTQEARFRDIYEYLDAKRTLEALGLSLSHLRVFQALKEELGPEGFERMASVLRSIDVGLIEGVSALLAAGLTVQEVSELRKLHRALRELDLPGDTAVRLLGGARELAALGFDAAAARALAREMDRLRRIGKGREEVARLLTAMAEQKIGAEEALVAAIQGQKEEEAKLEQLRKKRSEKEDEVRALAEREARAKEALEARKKEVEALEERKALLEAELKGLGRARSAPAARSHRQIVEAVGLLQAKGEKARQAIEARRKEVERLKAQWERARALPPPPPAAAPTPGGPASETAQPVVSSRIYSRIQERLRQAAMKPQEGPAPPPEAPKPPETVEERAEVFEAPGLTPADLEEAKAAHQRLAEALAALKAEADGLVREREELEKDVRERARELEEARALWALLGRGDPDLLAAAEGLIRAAREGPPPPDSPLSARVEAGLRDAARRLFESRMAPLERVQELQREVDDLRRRLENSVPRARFEALLKEAEAARAKLAETVPKWRAEAQEEEIRLLKRVAFERPGG